MAPLRSPLSSPEPDSAIVNEIARIAALPEVIESFSFVQSQESQFVDWQQEMARIPAPPFGEAARSEWLTARFRDLRLEDVHQDDVGNIVGVRRGKATAAKSKLPANHLAISAHIDTVFPAGTALNIRRQGSRLLGPGISDNGAGVIAMLAVAAALKFSRISHAAPILFIGNVGEEGEGDLRGMRHIFSRSSYKDTIRHTLVLDGAGCDTIVTEALGSRRFEVTVRGPGGHSWSDFGTPNPILVLAAAIHVFSRTPIPDKPKTAFNVGVIQGGTSVNSIPECASMRVDIRSASMLEIERLEQALRHAIDHAIEEQNFRHVPRDPQRRATKITSAIALIGNRPAGDLASNARILQVIRAVDAHLGNSAQTQLASTDANIPLSLGREAIALGGGGTGGGAHTLQEWFDCNGRDRGIKRILLTALALAATGD